MHSRFAALFRRKGQFAALLLLVGISSLQTSAQSSFQAGGLTLQLNAGGQISAIRDPKGRDLLGTDTLSPLLTVVSGGKRFGPTTATYNRNQKSLQLFYKEPGISVTIALREKATHLVAEITKAQPEARIEAVVWGPIHSNITETIGEVIGVVRDQQSAFGLQVLNLKTLGGDYPNKEGSTWARGIAALPTKTGSRIQAYSINRSLPRKVDAWGGNFKNMPVQPIKGETVVGSAIALFACDPGGTLDRLEAIELAEHLPHPTIKGVWFKKSPYYGKSYLISSFGESEVDEMIGYTKRAGLISLYHEGPFKSWGHYILNAEQFPNGRAGLKACVEKAHAAGLFFGVHTLTNFINTDDPYVSPVPDERLSVTGSSVLLTPVTADQTELEVASPEYFNEQQNNSLHTVKIGAELIRYKSVTEQAPYRLLDCQRGAFGTRASAHPKGATVGKLFDHPYNVFFPNLELQREIAGNIARLMNETGVDHLDFDGHEGALASGQGDYAIDLFAKDVYDQVQHDFICGTSLSKTFYWHIGSYYNWGEPWYGGFKESMQQYRIDNQGLFERNYMPHMLGWYLLTEKTTLPEMEWMLARAAGYNAGFAMVARPEAIRKNPLSPVLLDAIREWEKARNGGAFSKAQQEALKDATKEFHLEKLSDKAWELSQYGRSTGFKREKFIRQPGEPTYSKFSYEQPWEDQPLQFQLTVTGTAGAVKQIKLQVDNYTDIDLPVQLAFGESLVADGSQQVLVYDASGRLRQTLQFPKALPRMARGSHTITIDNQFEGTTPPVLEMTCKGLISKEKISLPQ